MNRSSQRTLAGVFVAVLIAGSAVAQGGMTQDRYGSGMMQGMGPGMMGGDDGAFGPMGRMGRMMMGDPGRHMAGRLAFIEAELGITEGQRPLWEAYAAAAREAADSMADMHARMQDLTGLPALPERLALMEELMESRLAALRAVREQATALYEGLTPEQRALADAVMGMGMGMM